MPAKVKDPTLVLTDEMKKRAAKTALLMCVTGANETVKGGSNKYYNMFLIDGSIIIEHGRVGVPSSRQLYRYDACEWDQRYRAKTQKRSGESYVDVTGLRQKSDYDYTGVPERVQVLLRRLIEESASQVSKNYSVASNDVTQAMIAAAQSIIDDIHNELTSAVYNYKRLNQRMLELYRTLPRKIANVQATLFTDQTPFAEIKNQLGEEQYLLDGMRSAVSALGVSGENVLKALNIDIQYASQEDYRYVKSLAGTILTPMHYDHKTYDVAHVYRVVNQATCAAFEERVARLNVQKVMDLWHGSRTANWLTLLSQGLKIRPAGAVYTGSMYGDACYFAPSARKSIGYTSVTGSRWARGSRGEGYLGLFQVAIGKEMIVHSADSRLTLKRVQQAGYDSVFAPAGSAVKNDERMVYDPCQTNIKFIVEVRPK